MVVRKRRQHKTVPKSKLDLTSETEGTTTMEDSNTESSVVTEETVENEGFSVAQAFSQLGREFYNIVTIPSIRVLISIVQYVGLVNYLFHDQIEANPLGRIFLEQLGFMKSVIADVFWPGNDRGVFERTLEPYYAKNQEDVLKSVDGLIHQFPNQAPWDLVVENWDQLLRAVLFVFEAWFYSAALTIAKLPAIVFLSFGLYPFRLQPSGIALDIVRGIGIMFAMLVVTLPTGLLELGYIALALLGVDWFGLAMTTMLGKHLAASFQLVLTLMRKASSQQLDALSLILSPSVITYLKSFADTDNDNYSGWFYDSQKGSILPENASNTIIFTVFFVVGRFCLQRLARRKQIIDELGENGEGSYIEESYA